MKIFLGALFPANREFIPTLRQPQPNDVATLQNTAGFKQEVRPARRAVFLLFFAQFAITDAISPLTARAETTPSPLPSLSPSPKPSPENLLSLDQLIDAENFRNIMEHADNWAASQIPQTIFNSVSHQGVTLVNAPQFSLNLNFGRDIYDNHTASGSWTIVDQIGVQGGIPLFNTQMLLNGLTNGLNFFIGTNLGVIVSDLRQVTPDGYGAVPNIGDRAAEISRGEHFQNYLQNAQMNSALINTKDELDHLQGIWVKFMNEMGQKVTSFLPADPESYARYAKIWNLFLAPFRLPLTKSLALKLDQNEIISYEGQGAIQSGFGTGWNIDPSGLTAIISAGVSISAYSRGNFRVSILKENGSTVKVKIAKTGNLGTALNAGGNYNPGILDNVIVINSLSNYLKIIPFQLSEGDSQSKTFEVTYQYDLATQAGATAYESAVLGNLKPSDELAMSPQGVWRTSLAETGVIKIDDYQGTTQAHTISNHMQLTFLFTQDELGQVTDTEAALTTASGQKRTLTALARNSKEWSLIFNQFQKYQHNFVVNLDLDLCEKNPAACARFPMQIEGRIDDSDTHQSSLLNYILEVEDSVNQPQMFSRTPEIRDLRTFHHDPLNPFYFYTAGHDLGNSHFYYSLLINPNQVQQFIDYPEQQMWPALERAFRVKSGSWSTESQRWLYGLARAPVTLADFFLNLFQLNWAPGTDLIHADQMERRWKQLKSVTHPVKKAEALTSTFIDPIYGKNMVNLVRTVLTNQEVTYYASGSNRVFGNVTQHGGSTLAFEDLASKLAQAADLKKDPTPEELDPELRVNDLQLSETSQGSVNLRLDTPIAPDSYYIDLTVKDWAQLMLRNKLVYAKVFKNPGLKPGSSEIALNPPSSKGAWNELAAHIQPNTRYLLRIAISKDGKKWGPVNQTEFRLSRNLRPQGPKL